MGPYSRPYSGDLLETSFDDGSSASAMKFLPYRVGMKVYTEQRLHYMKMLSDMTSGKGGGGGGGGGSGGGGEVSSGAADAAEHF